MSKIIQLFGAPVVSVGLQMDSKGQVQISGTRMGVLMSPFETLTVMAQTVGATLAVMNAQQKQKTEIKEGGPDASTTADNKND